MFFIFFNVIFRADLENYSIILGLTIPRIEVRGRYEVGGNVLLFPVRSKGDFWAAFSKYLSKNICIQSFKYCKYCT